MSTEANIQIPGELQDLEPGSQTEAKLGARPSGKQELAGAVHRNIQSSKTHALQAAGEFKTAVEAKGRELLHVADELLHAADGKAPDFILHALKSGDKDHGNLFCRGIRF